MGRLQTLNLILFALLTVFSTAANADWGLGVATGGFQGRTSTAVIWDWKRTHTIEFGVGEYSLDEKRKTQFNLSYRYTPFEVQWRQFTWAPTSIGLILIYANDEKRYFTQGPSKYPDEDYYDETGIRPGLEWSTQVTTLDGQIRLLYKIVLMDTGVVALINNDSKYAEYFYSSGLALQYFF